VFSFNYGVVFAVGPSLEFDREKSSLNDDLDFPDMVEYNGLASPLCRRMAEFQLYRAYENRYPGPLTSPWCLAVGLVIFILLGAPIVYGALVHPQSCMFHSCSLCSECHLDTSYYPATALDGALLAWTTWLFLPPAIILLYFVFFRNRHRADYRGVSKVALLLALFLLEGHRSM